MWLGNPSKLRRAGVAFAAAALMLTASGCNLLGQDDNEGSPVINSYVTGIEVLGSSPAQSQDVVNEQLGAGEADGPSATVEGSATVINGGSTQENITSQSEFTTVRVAVEELRTSATSAGESAAPPPASSGTPSRGYREIKLAQATNAVGLVVTVAQALPGQHFVLYFAVVDSAGKQGPLSSQQLEAVNVAAGVVQVSVSWDVDSDVDLYVIDPNGDEVYYGLSGEPSPSGGRLDLDSNANCDIDGTRNENITWPDTAPGGTYTVLVDLYLACGVSPTNYVVTVQVAGQPAQTYTGTLTGEGSEGETDPIQVTTFDVPEGATAPSTG